MNGWRRRGDDFRAPLSVCISMTDTCCGGQCSAGNPTQRLSSERVSAVFLLAAPCNKVPSAVYGGVFLMRSVAARNAKARRRVTFFSGAAPCEPKREKASFQKQAA